MLHFHWSQISEWLKRQYCSLFLDIGEKICQKIIVYVTIYCFIKIIIQGLDLGLPAKFRVFRMYIYGGENSDDLTWTGFGHANFSESDLSGDLIKVISDLFSPEFEKEGPAGGLGDPRSSQPTATYPHLPYPAKTYPYLPYPTLTCPLATFSEKLIISPIYLFRFYPKCKFWCLYNI